MEKLKLPFKAVGLCLVLLLCGVSAEEIKTQATEPSAFTKGSWTIVVVPDTQAYVVNERNHKVLNQTMDWVASAKSERNIKAVVHVGDMTQRNNEIEWRRIRSTYRKLDNVLPYINCTGNHDQSKGPKRATRMNEFFKLAENPLNKNIFGGSYEPGQLQNAYYTISQNGLNYLFLAIENKTRKSVMDWAEKVIKNHPDHRVFITVHEYMTEESRLLSKDGRPDPKGKDVVGVFERLAKLNPNVEFITCGHVKAVKKSDGKIIDDADIATGHRSDEMEDGVTVHQMLFNAQWLKNDKGQANGGDGWLLLLEFSADNKLVKVKTYSPYLDLWRTGSEYEYNLQRSTIKK